MKSLCDGQTFFHFQTPSENCISLSGDKKPSAPLLKSMTFTHTFHFHNLYSILVWIEKEKVIYFCTEVNVCANIFLPTVEKEHSISWGTSNVFRKLAVSLAGNWPEMETVSLSFSRRTFFRGSLTSTDPGPAARITQPEAPPQHSHPNTVRGRTHRRRTGGTILPWKGCIFTETYYQLPCIVSYV